MQLKNRVGSIDQLSLTDASGNEISHLTIDSYDATDRTWVGTVPTDHPFEMQQDTDVVLSVAAMLRDADHGGLSDETLQVDRVVLTVEGGVSQSTFEMLPKETLVYPKHQTTRSRITKITNALQDHGGISAGTSQLIAGFAFTGEKGAGTQLKLEKLEFLLTASAGVAAARIEMISSDSSVRTSCTGDTTNGAIITCLVPDAVASVDAQSRILRLFGNVSIAFGAQHPTFQLSLYQVPGMTVNSSVRWTDGNAHFLWIDPGVPVAQGTKWE